MSDVTVRPCVREDLTVVELDGEAVIYDEVTEQLHHLNPTATIVFSMCDGASTISDLAAEISHAFGVPTSEVESQIRSLVEDFEGAGLLVSGTS